MRGIVREGTMHQVSVCTQSFCSITTGIFTFFLLPISASPFVQYLRQPTQFATYLKKSTMYDGRARAAWKRVACIVKKVNCSLTTVVFASWAWRALTFSATSFFAGNNVVATVRPTIRDNVSFNQLDKGFPKSIQWLNPTNETNVLKALC